MALSYRARRRLSLLILLVGMPVWIVVAVTVVDLFPRAPFWLEALIYIALGIVWVLPFKSVFAGIGQPDPEAEQPAGDDPAG